MNSDNMIVGEGSRAGRIIGNIHPLYDFEENTKAGDVVTLAVENMGEVIVEIVEESFSDQRFAEAIECMRAMRKMALEVRQQLHDAFAPLLSSFSSIGFLKILI